jgi:hypothetical protein
LPVLLMQCFSRLKQQLSGLQYPPPNKNNHASANGQQVVVFGKVLQVHLKIKVKMKFKSNKNSIDLLILIMNLRKGNTILSNFLLFF